MSTRSAAVPTGAFRLVGAADPLTLRVLSALPKSSAFNGGDIFDRDEVLSVLKEMGVNTLGLGAADVNAPAILSHFVLATVDKILRRAGAGDQAWPTTAVSRLGGAIKLFEATGRAVPVQFPLVDTFKRLAAEGAWGQFLPSTLAFTAGSTGFTAGETSDVIMEGLLERYLSGRGVTAAQIGDRCSGGLDRDELTVMLFKFEPPRGTAAAAAPASGAGAALTRINLVQPDLSGTEDERRMRLQLRSDAEAVQDDPMLFSKLEALKPLSGAEIAIKLKGEADSLVRLVSNGAHIEKALAGMDGGYIIMVARIRNAIDRRIERAVYPNDEPSERVVKSMRKVRVGDFNGLDLLELIDCDGAGAAGSPLAGFEMFSQSLGLSKLSEAFSRIIHIVVIDEPEKAGVAIAFLNKLRVKIEESVRAGVSWTEVSAYYEAIIHKVSKPAMSFYLGEGGTAGPTFDVDWIDGNSTAREKLTFAVNKAIVECTVRAVIGSRVREAALGDLGGKRKLDDLLGGGEVTADVSLASLGGDDGSALGESADDRRLRASQYAEIRKSHPPVGGKQPCFFHFARGACLKGAACDYHHGK